MSSRWSRSVKSISRRWIRRAPIAENSPSRSTSWAGDPTTGSCPVAARSWLQWGGPPLRLRVGTADRDHHTGREHQRWPTGVGPAGPVAGLGNPPVHLGRLGHRLEGHVELVGIPGGQLRGALWAAATDDDRRGRSRPTAPPACRSAPGRPGTGCRAVLLPLAGLLVVLGVWPPRVAVLSALTLSERFAFPWVRETTSRG